MNIVKICMESKSGLVSLGIPMRQGRAIVIMSLQGFNLHTVKRRLIRCAKRG